VSIDATGRSRTIMLLALFAALGLSTGIVYTLLKADSDADIDTEIVTFSYQRATEREDGTPLLLEDIRYTRLFCDGKQVAQETGADGEISAELAGGSHDCYGTHVDIDDLQSKPSAIVTKFVEL